MQIHMVLWIIVLSAVYFVVVAKMGGLPGVFLGALLYVPVYYLLEAIFENLHPTIYLVLEAGLVSGFLLYVLQQNGLPTNKIGLGVRGALVIVVFITIAFTIF